MSDDNSLIPIGRGIVVHDAAYLSHIREAGKLSRSVFMDTIKRFSEYEDPTGDKSSSPKDAFMRTTMTIYSPLGLSSNLVKQLHEMEGIGNLRDAMDAQTLFAMSVLEDRLTAMIGKAIDDQELRTSIKAMIKDEAKRTAAFLGIQPKAKPAKRKAS